MIDAKDLRINNGDGTVTQLCPGKQDGCQEKCTVPDGKEPIFPYICNNCWVFKGWRNRGKFAYSPEEQC